VVPIGDDIAQRKMVCPDVPQGRRFANVSRRIGGPGRQVALAGGATAGAIDGVVSGACRYSKGKQGNAGD